jgi:glycosyltransferase involved in cell wall biosynthesis
MERHHDVSILIATNRGERDYLKTVVAIAKGCPANISVEVIVIRNSCGAGESRCSIGPSVTLALLSEPIAGKSNALNRGLMEASGEVVLFTDDDVVPSRNWVKRYFQAAFAHRQDDLFCGPILPLYPEGTPAWIPAHSYAGILYAHFLPRPTEGSLLPGVIPFGPNFAVRRKSIGNLKFLLTLGPSLENGPLMGEDVDFTSALRDRLCVTTESRGFRYLPECSVAHVIAPYRLEFRWMMERFFQLGRSRAIRFDRSSHLTSRPSLLHPSGISEPARAVTEGGELNFYCGQLHECLTQGKLDRTEYLSELLHRMNVTNHAHYYSPSMVDHMKTRWVHYHYNSA